jgi:hypothetical protein
VQEAEPHPKDRVLVALHQTLGLHRPGVVAGVRLAERPRMKDPKRPALPALDLGPVRVENIPLVQDGLGDPIQKSLVHGAPCLSEGASSVSSACSQLGRP